MLSELRQLRPTILQSVLEGIYMNLLQTPAQALFKTDFEGFSIDNLFVNVREFILDLVKDTTGEIP